MSVEERLSSLADSYRKSLLEETLPFWLAHAIDHEHDGYCTSLDRTGAVIDTDKAIWQQGRFAWLLAKMFNTVEPRADWRAAAESGIRFLDAFGTDPADGRMWFLTTREGKPLRKRRYSFSESFAAIACAEFARATGNDEYAAKAIDKFHAFVTPLPTEPKWTTEREMQSIGVPMITINAAQELRESIGFESANRFIDDAIAKIRDEFVCEEHQCVLETTGPGGEVIDHFDGRTLNPGHAIEAAWFIMREGAAREDQSLVALGCKMLDWMWQRGWDEEFGGLFYFTGIDERPIQEYWHDMKFWWTHCEALVATLFAWKLTGEPRYAKLHLRLFDWCESHFRDHEHGEWFGYLHRDGTVSNTLKGNWWKGPFHLPRMQWMCWRMLQQKSDE